MSGKSLKEVNWAKVGVSALSGGVSAAVPGGFITAAVIGGTTDVAFDAIDGNINSVGDAVKSFAWGAVKEVVSQGVGKALDKGIGKLAGKFAGKSGTGTKDIYRAVSPEEFDDIFATGGFRARPDGRSFQAKEFGNSFDETLEFANKPINLDKAAIVKVTIPENVYNQLHHMNLDRAIFKSGTPVVEPEMLDMFNESIISIEHAF